MIWLLAGLAVAAVPVEAGVCAEKAYQRIATAVEQRNAAALRQQGAKSPCLRDERRPSLLLLAAQKSSPEIFRLLLDLGADPNLRNIKDATRSCSYQVLHLVQLPGGSNAFPFVDALLAAGADPHSCPEDFPGHCGEQVCDIDKLPAGQAAERGDAPTLSLLVSRSARIHGDELLYSAANDPTITAGLLQLGADPGVADHAPIFRTRSAEALRFLVGAGADINHRQFGYGGAIPLAIYSQPDVFALEPVLKAIDLGADLRLPMTRAGSGFPCAGLAATLCWAQMMSPSSLEALYYGLIHSSRVNNELADEEGRTVLMLLSRYYFYRNGRKFKTACLEELIRQGSNVRATDKKGKSVLQYWEEYAQENRAEIPLIKAALGTGN